MRSPVRFCGCAALAALLAAAPTASAQIIPLPVPLTGEAGSGTPSGAFPASFSQLFTETVGDLTRLPSRENLTWLGIGAVAALAAHAADHQVTTTVTQTR